MKKIIMILALLLSLQCNAGIVLTKHKVFCNKEEYKIVKELVDLEPSVIDSFVVEYNGNNEEFDLIYIWFAVKTF